MGKELKSWQCMVEDALAKLNELNREDLEPWNRRMPWWPPCIVQRLRLRFSAEHLKTMRALRFHDTAALPNIAAHSHWESLHEGIKIQGVAIPSALQVTAQWDGTQQRWSAQFVVYVSTSGFALYARGVQHAVIVH